jgi:hypothetical protein
MIPAAIARALTLPHLEADPFVATQWRSAEHKAKFGNHLLRFVAEEYPRHLFTKPFYRLLSNHFGHITHYSRRGFWDHYFTDERTKAEFLTDTVRHWACGDPGYTFSDLEFIVQGRITKSGMLEWQRHVAKSETEAIDARS